LTAENSGDYEEAERSMDWAIRMNRVNPWIHMANGRYLERRERLEEALQAYTRAIDLGGLPEAREAMGIALFRMGDDEAAVKMLRAVNSERAYANLVLYFIDMSEMEEAAVILDQWATFPPNAEWVGLRTHVATLLEQQGLVWEDYLYALEERPSYQAAENALLASTAACEQGELWHWAVDNPLVVADSRWRTWARELAFVVGDEEWNEKLVKAQAARGQEVIWWYYLRDNRRYSELKSQTEGYLEVEPTSLEAGWLAGEAYRGLHDYEGAIRQWKSVLIDYPGSVAISRSLAKLRVEQGRLDDALSVTQMSLEATEESIDSVLLRSEILAAGGDEKNALLALAKLPADQRAEATVGVYLELGNFDEASHVAVSAARADLMARVGETATERGQGDKFVDLWRETLRLSPRSFAARYLNELGILSISEALESSPCDPELLWRGWERSESCGDLGLLERAYHGYPGRFSFRYSREAARCGLWEQALESARWSLRIEDSAARRRHLDYVQQAQEKLKRVRRKP
jgi:tetratricopeptide (TPR) repeat protein